MTDWTTEIPRASPYNDVPLLRTPAVGAIAGHILVDNIIGTLTHWAQGRTQPCEMPNCQHCLAKIPYRYHAYIAIISDKNGRQAVLELTAAPAATLKAWRLEHNTLRGTHIIARRTVKRANGKVTVDLSVGTIPPNKLPSPVSCEKFMSDIWNLAETRMHNRIGQDGRQRIDITKETPPYVSDDLPPQIAEACADILNLYTGNNGQQPPPAA